MGETQNKFAIMNCITILLFLRITSSFVIQPRIHQHQIPRISNTLGQHVISKRTRHYTSKEESEVMDSEIERLRTMAAKLRAEAATLEAQKAQELSAAAEKAFLKFDLNDDGEISADELKAGLEAALKIDLTDKRVAELMAEFDASGDGALQLDEFPTIDQFRNQLDSLVRKEKQMALDAAKEAKLAEEAVLLAEAKLELINNKPPSNTDKFVSIIPYLFPLLDGLQYGKYFLNDSGDNPLVVILAVIYTLYRSIPFGGFIAFFALNILSGNLQINRLIRYNMQQAIFVDIALILPGLFTGLFSVLAGAAGADVGVPESLRVVATDAVFVSLILVLAYCSVSSVLGIEPNKLPLISERVSRTMPTIDMFDDQGRFMPPDMREEEEKKKKDD